METYTLKRHVDENGVLDINLSVGIKDVDVEVVVQPISEANTNNLPRNLKKSERANEPWSDEEEQKLLKMYHAGAPKTAIASHLKRSRGAIQSRLKMLGVNEDE